MSIPSTSSPEHRRTRAGFVAIVGRPNAGKSTLLNRLVGTSVSIVSPKAQTTWAPVTAILTRPDAQLVFVDTPGFLSDPTDRLQEGLLSAARDGARSADVVLLLLDGARPTSFPSREALTSLLEERRGRLLVAVNKVDTIPRGYWEDHTRWALESFGVEAFPISARDGDGVGALLDALVQALPESPFLYPEDDLAIAPVRFFVSELVRETVFHLLSDELPWSVLPRVEGWHEAGEEGRDRTYIQVTLYVERNSQKGILVGEGGKMIRQIGLESRARIEAFLEGPVYLDLWVKVLPRWRKKRGELLRMGLPVGEEPKDTPKGAGQRGKGRDGSTNRSSEDRRKGGGARGKGKTPARSSSPRGKPGSRG